jgi:hypothetical protein
VTACHGDEDGSIRVANDATVQELVRALNGKPTTPSAAECRPNGDPFDDYSLVFGTAPACQ